MVTVELNKKNIIVVDREDKAIELATEEYFKGNQNVKINGMKFDIFNFGNFDYEQKAQALI